MIIVQGIPERIERKRIILLEDCYREIRNVLAFTVDKTFK